MVISKEKITKKLLFGFVALGVLSALPKSEKEAPELFYPAYSYTDNISLEPNYSTGYNGHKQKDITYDYINVNNVWNSYRGEKIKLALIDTGANINHEDFRGTNISTKSYDVAKKTNVITDTKGHGSDTAATVAAAVNQLGGVGIAPNVEVYIIRAVDESNAFPNSYLQSALDYCLKEHVDVINMSVQGYTTTFDYEYISDYSGNELSGTVNKSSLNKSTLQSRIDACYEAGITIVAAAGNFNTNNLSFPAANDHVIGVGSSGYYSSSTKAGFSNYGSYIDVVAPGYVVAPGSQTTKSDTNYTMTSGTSFSAPLVAGAIALYKSKYPSATPDQIETQLKATCHALNWSEGSSGSGLIDVEAFLNNGPAEAWVDATNMEIDDVALAEGQQTTITPQFTPSNASRQTCYWESSNTNVCSVDVNGKITAKTRGIATITATSIDGGFTDSCQVNVGSFVPVTGVEITPTSLDLICGESSTLSAHVLPLDATDKDVMFESSDDNVATVEMDTGVVTAIGEGTCTITAYDYEMEHSATCTVHVTDPREWYLVKNNGDLVVGDSYVIAAKNANYSMYEQRSNNWSQTSIAKQGDKLSNIGSSQPFELVTGKVSNTYGFKYGQTAKYLYASSSSNNNLGSQTTLDENGSFAITIDADGTASIVAQGSNTRNILCYNSSSSPNIFSCYSTKQADVCLYRYGLDNKTLTSIEVNNPQTSYFIGTSFVQPSVTAHYSNGGTSEVGTSCTFTGFNSGSAVSSQTISVSYSDAYGSANTSYIISIINKELTSITCSNPKTTFVVGDTFQIGDSVHAHFNDGSDEVVTNVLATGYDMSSAGNQTVTLSYTYLGITKTLSYSITVEDMSDKVTLTNIKFISDSTCTDSGNNTWTTNKTPSNNTVVLNASGTISSDVINDEIDMSNSIVVKVTMAINGTKDSQKLVVKAVNSSNTAVTNAVSIQPANTSLTEYTFTLTPVSSYDGSDVKFLFSTSSASNSRQIKFASATVTYTKVKKGPEINSISLNTRSATLDLKQGAVNTVQLTPTVDADEGADTTVYWTSSAPAYVSISASSGSKDTSITVTGLQVTNEAVNVTATCGDKSDTCTVTVIDTTPIPVSSITLSDSSASISKGSTKQLTATVNPSNATVKTVTWSSSNTAIATVDGNGLITAQEIGGPVTITCSATDGSGVKATCSVTVTTGITLDHIGISGISSTVSLGDDYSTSGIVVTAYMSDSTQKVITSDATITANIDTLVLGTQYVSASYTEGLITKSAQFAVKITNNGADVGVDIPSHEETTYADASTTQTITSYSFDGVDSSVWNCNKTGTVGYESSRGFQLQANATCTISSITDKFYNISSISISVARSSKGTGSFSVKVGDTTIGTVSSFNTTSTASTFTVKNLSGIITISGSASSSSLYIKSFSVQYQEKTTVIVPGKTYDASPIEQAQAWSSYFLSLTSGLCNNDPSKTDVSGLVNVWQELKSEYNYMIALSKSEFASSSDSIISEARERYTAAVKNHRDQLENFVLDNDNSLLVSDNNVNLFGESSSTIILIVVSSLIAVSLCAGYFFVHRKRESID